MSDGWIVDASVAAKWVLPEADSEAALRLMGRKLLAPAFIDVECANILWKAMRRGELTAEQAHRRHQALRDAPIERLPDAVLLPMAMFLATELRHPVYDCLYLSAVELTGARLVTADRRLLTLNWRDMAPPHWPLLERVVSLDDLP